MGVRDLLKYLEVDGETVSKRMQTNTHVTVFRPQTENRHCYVDASCIIHQALGMTTKKYLQAVEIARGIWEYESGGVTDAVEKAIIRKFKTFENTCTTYLGCTPIFVFDGKIPKAKGEEHSQRLKLARSNYDKWKQLDQTGRGNSPAGQKAAAAACIRTWQHNRIALGYCETMRCELWVAPYEADSFLVYLAQRSPVDAFVATIDSDIPVYEPGINVCFGFIRECTRENASTSFKVCMFTSEHRRIFLEKEKLTDAGFLAFCLLRGCDYTRNLRKEKQPLCRLSMGDIMKKVRVQLMVQRDDSSEGILNALKIAMNDNTKYEACVGAFRQALHAYRNAWVFDTVNMSCVTLRGESNVPSTEIDIADQPIDATLVTQFATGQIDPDTGKIKPIEAFGINPLPLAFSCTVAYIPRTHWHTIPAVTKDTMLDYFGKATYLKGQQRTAAHTQIHPNTQDSVVGDTILREAKEWCRYKWMDISISMNSVVMNDVTICVIYGRIPRSMHTTYMEAYAELRNDTDDGHYYVASAFCKCSLGVQGKCVHAAGLVWTARKQSEWAAHNVMERYKYDPIFQMMNQSLGEDDDQTLCTSNPSKWNVPSGNLNRDLTIPIHALYFESPKTLADRQDKMSEESPTSSKSTSRKIRNSVGPRVNNRKVMAPLDNVMTERLEYEGSKQQLAKERFKHMALFDDIREHYNLKMILPAHMVDQADKENTPTNATHN